MGVPTIGCQCAVCASTDPRDKRMRPSILIQYNPASAQGRNVLIDTGPDLRSQALNAGMCRLDAVLYTHPHADHILGLDDVRPFNLRQQGDIPLYGSRKTLDALRERFSYIFTGNYPWGGVAKVSAQPIDGSIDLFQTRFTPVPVLHGHMVVWGYRFGRCAYLTDYQHIPESSYALLQDLDVLFLDALRHEPHPTHCTVEQAVAYAQRFRARRALLTHIAHDLGHAETNASLPAGVECCYDGMQLEVEL